MARGGQVWSQEEEYVRGAWEWARELGCGGTLGVRVVLHPSVRKGVWVLRAEVAEVASGRLVRVHSQALMDWPTSQPTSLGGAVLALMVKLDKDPYVEPLEAPAQR